MWPYEKYSSQQGIALMAVLIFMQIIAMFSLCAVETVITETRIVRNVYRHYQLFNAAEYGLKRSEEGMSATCILPITSVMTLTMQPLEWWRSRPSCAGNFPPFEYYYVTEFLGNDACAYVTPDKKTTADYFRITVLALDDTGSEKVFLQTTFVKPSPLPATCEGDIHPVRAGRQSWNEIV